MEAKLKPSQLWARTLEYVGQQCPDADAETQLRVASNVYDVMRFLVKETPVSAGDTNGT